LSNLAQLLRSVLLVFVLVGALAAQETVFNVPSGDILEYGKVYSELDASYRPSDSLKTLTPRIVVGVGHNIEVGVNINGIATPAPSQTTITPTIKCKFYDSYKNGWALLAGSNLFIPVQNRTFNAGTWAYAEMVKSWTTRTRATFGAYYASRNIFASFQRAGGQFAIEQTLTKHITLAADWFTGDVGVGYFTPGVIVKGTPRLTWYLTYQLGNSGMDVGNHQVLMEIGWNWD
jgi:hypothetical protein